MKRGFTMVETMVAAAIGVVVLLAVGAPFMAVYRMLHVATAESELALAMRDVRDKILFKASPDMLGNHYAGLLSGVNLNESDVQGHGSGAVEMGGRTVGATLGSTADSSLRLLVWTVGDDKFLINERTPNKDAHVHWIWPISFAFAKWTNPEENIESMSDILSYSSRNSNGSNIYRLDFSIALAAGVRRRDGTRIVRKECVPVPILGKLQPMKDAAGRY